MSLPASTRGGRQGAQGALQRSAVTKEGCRYDPSLDVWRLHDGGTEVVLDFGRFRLCCTNRFVGSLKKYMVGLLRKQALDSCENFFQRVRRLARHASGRARGTLVDAISIEDVLSYRASLDRQNEYLFHAMRKRLREWVLLGFHGVEPDVPELLDQMKLKGNESGVAVRNHDPVRGTFNDEEFQSLVQYLLDNYAAGVIDLSDLALGFLFLAFGPRPISFAALRVKDFQMEKNRKGVPRYKLKIPAAKRQRGGRRTHFNTHPLTGEYGQMVVALVESVKRRFAGEVAAGFDFFLLSRCYTSWGTTDKSLTVEGVRCRGGWRLIHTKFITEWAHTVGGRSATKLSKVFSAVC